MPELPWKKWYPTNWASEPGLKLCSLSARGLWIDLLNTMMLKDTPRLTHSPEDFCALFSCKKDELLVCFSELKSHDVGNVREHNGNIIVECRRMLREYEIKELRRKAGKLSAAKRQHDPQHDVPTPSASASASASKIVIGTLYHRPGNQPWSYMEESTLAALLKRPAFAEELELIKRWSKTLSPEDQRYKWPKTVFKLLEDWGGTLDKARAVKVRTTTGNL